MFQLPASCRAIFMAFVILASQHAKAEEKSLLLQSTTSTKNSGLYDVLLPNFEERFKATIRVVAVGTGQAIQNARNCDADVLIVHSKEDEETFVAQGYGVARHDLMYNDFVIVGPADDPASLLETSKTDQALTNIFKTQVPFASRADQSGTHKKERLLWQNAGLDPDPWSGSWYRELGSSMGATLNTGIAMDAYILTDRATWLSFESKRDYQILFEGDPDLFNQYGIIQIDPGHCPYTNKKLADQFVGWLLSKEGQEIIASHQINGQQLFFPNASEKGQ